MVILSSWCASPEAFKLGRTILTDLALDPPRASGDGSGPPLLDEDYLILSTVHSAKGQEWTEVFVLNVNDGNFPSEFAAGSPALLDEERRLLYVAMTRARDALHLIAPLKYYVTQQPRYGDAHVYGARSRFLTPDVLATMECARGRPRQCRYADRRRCSFECCADRRCGG
jgi:DNA helicase-2/ATP-dependent DNA helicase PcrA